MKRCIDILLSSVSLVILSPVLLIVALIIKKYDGGSVFYAPLRVGLYKKYFRMYKFRTMVANADKIGGPTTSARDPRITPIGHFLRRFKLDELPQLINVFRGEMSLVGPRPEVTSEVEHHDPKWDVIFSVRPGITDLASIEFRNEGEIVANSGIEDPHEAYKQLIQPRKLELQREYALNHSLWLDIKILGKTLLAVIGK
jgi:lipopolysaccharide/colanic/teichoic acid biosynthesis glycosyltransferase